MKFTEAFRQLGYTVANPRQDWPAQKADGICMTEASARVERDVIEILKRPSGEGST